MTKSPDIRVPKGISTQEPRFTFGEVVTATGADELWFRSLLQRDRSSAIGTKDKRLGRLMFSFDDVMQVALIHSLNAFAKIPPQSAREICAVALSVWANMDQPSLNTDLHVGFSDDGRPLVWTIADGVVTTWSDAADEALEAAKMYLSSRRPHITFNMEWLYEAPLRATMAAERGV